MAETTLNLGPEYDTALRSALMEALREIGASVSDISWAVGGSQEVTTVVVDVGGVRLFIESETYIGLTLTGERETVTRITERTRFILADS